jgi:hypothetical protein
VVSEVEPSEIDTFLVTPARFERAAYSLEGYCSIQLSYGVKKGPSEQGFNGKDTNLRR